jgi:hypothetical protein
MRGVSACPRNIFQKGYENLVVIFRTGEKPCTWVHVVVSKRRKVEASNSEQKVCCEWSFRNTFPQITPPRGCVPLSLSSRPRAHPWYAAETLL